MRSSLVRFFICIVAGLIAVPAFGQTQQVNSQSADYWQNSSRATSAPTHTVSTYNPGLQTASCPCEEDSSPVPAPVPTAYTAGYTQTPGQSTAYNTVGYTNSYCPPAYGAGNCETGTCAAPTNGYVSGGYSNCGNCGTCDPCHSAAGCTTGYATGGFGFGSYANTSMMDMGCGVFPAGSGQWFLTGWIQQGITINPRWPDNRFNGTFKYNDRANDYQMNQLYLTFGRAVNSEACKWDIGGRIDLLYGTDYHFTSALGLETETYIREAPHTKTLDPMSAKSKWNKNDGPRANGNAAMYGFSMPQLYGEIQGPIGTNIKLGHFYSPMGHESVMATQNFFYSHSYSMMHGGATTVTGGLLAQRITQNLTGYFGIHQGWDKWESPISEISYIAGAKWENVYRTTSLGFFVNTGKDAYGVTEDARRTEANRTNYSLVFSHQLTPCLHYVLQHDLGVDEDAGWTVEKGVFDGKWYSVANYLYLQMTPTLAFGARVEWFKDENHTRVLGLNVPSGTMPGIDGDEFIDVSLGLNWKPTSFMTFRPEVRWDWAKDCKIFNDGKDTNLFTIAGDLVINF